MIILRFNYLYIKKYFQCFKKIINKIILNSRIRYKNMNRGKALTPTSNKIILKYKKAKLKNYIKDEENHKEPKPKQSFGFAGKKIIISSYLNVKEGNIYSSRVRCGKQLKNNALFLLKLIIKQFYLMQWKKKIISMKYMTSRYNAKRANFKILMRNLSTTLKNHQFSSLNEIFSKMKKCRKPKGLVHDPNFGKLKIVDNDFINKKYFNIFYSWGDKLINKEKSLLINTLTEAFRKTKVNNNSKLRSQHKNSRNSGTKKTYKKKITSKKNKISIIDDVNDNFNYVQPKKIKKPLFSNVKKIVDANKIINGGFIDSIGHNDYNIYYSFRGTKPRQKEQKTFSNGIKKYNNDRDYYQYNNLYNSYDNNNFKRDQNALENENKSLGNVYKLNSYRNQPIKNIKEYYLNNHIYPNKNYSENKHQNKTKLTKRSGNSKLFSDFSSCNQNEKSNFSNKKKVSNDDNINKIWKNQYYSTYSEFHKDNDNNFQLVIPIRAKDDNKKKDMKIYSSRNYTTQKSINSNDSESNNNIDNRKKINNKSHLVVKKRIDLNGKPKIIRKETRIYEDYDW